MNTRLRYGTRTIVLHWLTAALVLALWIVGKNINDFARGDPRMLVRSLHMLLGACLGLVLVVRIHWRLRGGDRLPPTGSGPLEAAASLGHLLLYLLLITVVLLGLANVWIRGDTWFNLVTVPALDAGDTAMRRCVEHLHSWGANLLLVVAGGHALAAVLHQFVLKDGVLQRMLPRR